MKIAIGADHGGFDLKESMIAYLGECGIDVSDCGIYKCESADYPDSVVPVAKQVLQGEAQFGIVICGTGIGVCISANKINGIRCALCTDPYMSRMSRRHNDANILAMGGRVIGSGLAKDIVDTFIKTAFESGGRHENRVNKIMELEKQK
jgi:ribose 5-phosphate isomerase B